MRAYDARMTVYQFGVVFFLAVGTVGGIHALSSIAARLDAQNRLLERSVRLAEEREAQKNVDRRLGSPGD